VCSLRLPWPCVSLCLCLCLLSSVCYFVLLLLPHPTFEEPHQATCGLGLSCPCVLTLVASSQMTLLTCYIFICTLLGQLIDSLVAFELSLPRELCSPKHWLCAGFCLRVPAVSLQLVLFFSLVLKFSLDNRQVCLIDSLLLCEEVPLLRLSLFLVTTCNYRYIYYLWFLKPFCTFVTFYRLYAMRTSFWLAYRNMILNVFLFTLPLIRWSFCCSRLRISWHYNFVPTRSVR
jgi:hypothetical protein